MELGSSLRVKLISFHAGLRTCTQSWNLVWLYHRANTSIITSVLNPITVILTKLYLPVRHNIVVWRLWRDLVIYLFIYFWWFASMFKCLFANLRLSYFSDSSRWYFLMPITSSLEFFRQKLYTCVNLKNSAQLIVCVHVDCSRWHLHRRGARTRELDTKWGKWLILQLSELNAAPP